MDYIRYLREKIGSAPVILVAAGSFLLTKELKLLLQRRVDDGIWDLPGGLMELGETPEQTARREVFEETGLELGALKLLGVYSGPNFYKRYANGDEAYSVAIIYFCNEFSGQAKNDPKEGLELGFFALDELPKDLSPTITHSLSTYLKNC